MGNVLFTDGRTREAVAAYRAALDTGRASDVPMAHNNLGNALSDLGDTESAMKEYQRGLKLAPRFTYLHNGLANLLSSRSRDSEAVAILQQAAHVQPSAHYAYFNLGAALRRLKRHPEAERAYRAAVGTAPSDARYTQGLGQLCHEARRPQEAAWHYARASGQLLAAGQPRSAALERDHATALREARRHDEAVSVARGVLDLEPEVAGTFNTLAMVLREVRAARRVRARISPHLQRTSPVARRRAPRAHVTPAAGDSPLPPSPPLLRHPQRARRLESHTRLSPGGCSSLATFSSPWTR